MHTKAIYAASLDPITNGHLWVIDQSLKLFDEVVVAIAINPLKIGKYFFTQEERVSLSMKCVSRQVLISSIKSQYLVDFAQESNATHLVRGARNSEDFAVEATMAEINRKMAKNRGFSLETVILTPPNDLSIISSSFVKNLVGYDGWQKEIRQYVPEIVAQSIEKKYEIN